MVARVDLAADWVHDDTACVRMLTESGIMLWRHRLVGVISSKSLIECYARNLRPETWRWWLSGCPRKHLFFVPSTGKRWPNLLISSRGSLSDHDAVFLTGSDIFFWLSMVSNGMMNTSLNKIFLKYSLVSPVVVSLYREASQVSLFHTCEGAACCVDAHLPTVDERFRTCLQ